MKAAIYCRVSTEDQQKEGTSLQSQSEYCLAKAYDLKYEVPNDLTYLETYSGLTLDRPQLKELRKKISEGEVAAVVVFSPDRLCRVGEDILSLAKELKMQGVKLVFVKEQWEDTLNGKLIAFILGWASEFESAQIRERTTRGKRVLVDRGLLPQGTGIGLYGYQWDKQKKQRAPLEFEAKIVQKVFSMIAEGHDTYHVAKSLNEKGIPSKSGSKWHPLTIKRMATNPAYIGLTYFGKTRREGKKLHLCPEDNWKVLPNVTPPIVSKELFDKVQKVIQRPKIRSGRPLHDYLLRGHIVCGYCGSRLVGSCLNHLYRYYHCSGARPTVTRSRICHARYVRAEHLEGVVWGKVREILENPQVVLAELKRRAEEQEQQAGGSSSIDLEILKARRDIRDTENQEKRLITLYRYGEITDDYILNEVRRLKKLRKEAQDQLDRLHKVKKQAEKIKNAEIKLDNFCQKVQQNLDKCTIEDKRLALEALDIQVTVTSERIEVQGVIPINFITIERTSA